MTLARLRQTRLTRQSVQLPYTRAHGKVIKNGVSSVTGVTRSSRINTFDKGNATAAGIILEQPEHYGPGMTAWARLYMQRRGTPLPKEATPCQIPLDYQETECQVER
jgi:hypothetical protein